MFFKNPTEWARTLDTSDFPHNYFIVFGGFLSTIAYLILPKLEAELLMSTLIKLVLPADDAEFLNGKYLPELGEAAKDVHLTSDQKKGLLRKIGGVLMKFLYAFLF